MKKRQRRRQPRTVLADCLGRLSLAPVVEACICLMYNLKTAGHQAQSGGRDKQAYASVYVPIEWNLDGGDQLSDLNGILVTHAMCETTGRSTKKSKFFAKEACALCLFDSVCAC